MPYCWMIVDRVIWYSLRLLAPPEKGIKDALEAKIGIIQPANLKCKNVAQNIKSV